MVLERGCVDLGPDLFLNFTFIYLANCLTSPFGYPINISNLSCPALTFPLSLAAVSAPPGAFAFSEMLTPPRRCQTLRATQSPSPPISHGARRQSLLAQASDWIQIWFFRHSGHLLSQSLDVCCWSHLSVIRKPGPLTSLRPLLRCHPPRKGSPATPLQAAARLLGSLSAFCPPMQLFP